MAIVKCMTMHKNEPTYLETWIKYYGYLFGFENLYIVDNGSKRENIDHIVDIYSKSGCHFFLNYPKKEHFLQKGEIMGEIIRTHIDHEPHDFILPMDCDEYLFLYMNTPSFSRTAIHAYLDRIRHTPDALIIEHMFLNTAGDLGYFERPRGVSKGMFTYRNFQHIDHGFHYPVSKNGRQTKTSLGYLHLHNKTRDECLAAAKEKLAHLVDINDMDALLSYTGPGLHLINHFLTPESDFYKTKDQYGRVYIGAFYELIMALSHRNFELFGPCAQTHPKFGNEIGFVVRYETETGAFFICQFDSVFYLKEYEDIRGHDLDPIWHFCEYGAREGRKPNAEGLIYPVGSGFLEDKTSWEDRKIHLF